MKLKSTLCSGLLAVSMLFAVAAQAADDATYQDFGGNTGLTKVVDDLMYNLLADGRTQKFFEHADQSRIKAKLVEQFCQVLEGPCKYTGHSMKEAHDGLGIKEADFNALVEDLQKAMTKNEIPQRAQNKLLAKLAPMHRDIIKK